MLQGLQEADVRSRPLHPRTVAALLSTAGLTDVTWHLRAPMPWRDETTERAYVSGRLP